MLDPTSITDAGSASGTGPQQDQQTAVDKALTLLMSLAEEDREVGVSELARRTQLTKSTAFRLLGILQRNDVVERVGSSYRLGPQLFDIGRRVYGPMPLMLQERLLPFLTELYVLTQETVHLAVLHRTEVIYVNKLHGHRRTRTPTRIGSRMPASCTAVGKALLAFDHDAAELAIAQGLPERTEHSVTDPARFRAELARIRREGIAYEREEVLPGLTCVAVPVMGAAGRPVAAISVSGAPHRIELARIAPELRRVAFEAARELGTVVRPRSRRTSAPAEPAAA
ncbi:IclR family transcriptional regulator [Streptomyces sp. NPDC052052]|uniref:IclR family transcriptional regulator n=1 Tax=Streptomyces sp. NPDC052052 TaxID=3154756 RepID=UPI00344497D6